MQRRNAVEIGKNESFVLFELVAASKKCRFENHQFKVEIDVITEAISVFSKCWHFV